MTIITFGQVVARYVFNYSFVWALELRTYLFAALIFLGISYGVRVGAHIGVDPLVKVLPKAVANKVAVVATLLCLLYAVIVVVGSWIYVSTLYEIGIVAQELHIPQCVPRLDMPIEFPLLPFRFAEFFYDLHHGKQAHRCA